MKKVIALLLVLMMAVGMLAGCTSSDPGSSTQNPGTNTQPGAPDGTSEPPAGGNAENTEKMIVGVVVMASGDAMTTAQNYLTDVVGPALNMEFIFSEVINDAGAMTTFIENAKASGAQGIINMLANLVEQAASTCEDLGMWEVDNASASYESVESLPHHIGLVGLSPEGNGKVFGEAIQSALDAGEDANVLVLSGAACFGATSQIEATVSMLTTLQNLYGLTYTEDLKTLATVNSTTDVETGTDMKVTIHPGVPMGADYASAVSSLLQTGDYNVVCSAFDAYGAISVAIDEVEKALGMNIKVITQMSISDNALASMRALDSTGDACVNAGVSGELTPPLVYCALMLRNAFDGHADAMRTDGKATVLLQDALLIDSAETLEKLMQVPPSYMSEDDIASLWIAKNPDCTIRDFRTLMDTMTTENILAKFAG